MKIQKVQLRLVSMICVVLILSSQFLLFTPDVKGDSTHPGLPGEEVEGPTNSGVLTIGDNINERITEYGSFQIYYTGLVTALDEIDDPSAQAFLTGPEIRRVPTSLDYVQNMDLLWEIWGFYRPIAVVRSAPWYDHTFYLSETEHEDVKITQSFGIGVKYGTSNIFWSEETSVRTDWDYHESWHATAEAGQTMVIYVWTTWLVISGSVTYTGGETRDYDSILLLQMNYEDYYPVYYDWGDEPDELPEDLEENYYDDTYPRDQNPPQAFSSIDGTMQWTTTHTITNKVSFSLDILLFIPPKWWMGLLISYDLQEVRSVSESLTIKHEFVHDPGRHVDPPWDETPFFYKHIENGFSTNYLFEDSPDLVINSPSSGSVLSGIESLNFEAFDNQEVSSVKCWLSEDASFNEVDDDYLGEAIPVIPPLLPPTEWNFQFNTGLFDDFNDYYIFCRAYDNFGAWDQEIIEHVEIDNWYGSISSPTQNQNFILGADVNFMAYLTDASGIDKVQFRKGSGSWQDASWYAPLARWKWTWDSSGSSVDTYYTFYCRSINDYGTIRDLGSVQIKLIYCQLAPIAVTPLTYSSYSNAYVTTVSFDDGSCFQVLTKHVGWGWHDSVTRFTFDYSYDWKYIYVKLQLGAATYPAVSLKVKCTDGTSSSYYAFSPSTTSTQTCLEPYFNMVHPDKPVRYLYLWHHHWWTDKWLKLDFIHLYYYFD